MSGRKKISVTSGLPKMALPEKIRKWRVDNQKPVEEAAKELGVGVATWDLWETGALFPGGNELYRLSVHTGMSLHDLICPDGDS